MSTSRKTEVDRLAEYDRMMLRSSFLSLFWSVIIERRKRGKFMLQWLADFIGINKSSVSRWFSSPTPPNWETDTLADIARALDLELKIEAVERSTGVVFSASGPVIPQTIIVSPTPMTSADPAPEPTRGNGLDVHALVASAG